MSTTSSGDGSHAPSPPDPVLVLGGKHPVTSLVYVSGDVIVTGHQNGMIQEWNLPIRRTVSTWSGHSEAVIWLRSISVVPVPAGDADDIVLLSQGRDGCVKAWVKHEQGSNQWTLIDQIPSAPLIFCNSAVIDLTSSRFIATPTEETSHINIHTISINSQPQEETEPAASRFSIIKALIRTLKPEDSKGYGMCMRMCAVPNYSNHLDCRESHLLVGYESGAIALWNILKGEMIHSHKLHDDSVMGLSCWSNPTSGQIKGLSATVNNVIQSWTISDTDNNIMISKDNSVSVINEGFNSIAIRADGRIFATGGWDGRGRVFSLKKLRPLAVLTYHKESINCVAFGPNNELVLGSKDGYISFWNVFKNN